MAPAIVISGRYEILGAIQKAGGRSYHARHKTLGHPLMVHFLPGGASRQGAALIDKIQLLAEPERDMFIDSAEHDGVPFVVSKPLPDFDNLAAWIDRALAKSAPPAPAPAPPVEGAATMIFSAPVPKAPAPPVAAAPPPPPPPPTPAPPPAPP